MYTLIFDTETTGLPEKNPLTRKFYEPREVNRYNGARLVEIAYRIVNEDNEVFVGFRSLVKFNGINITNSDIHGITTEMCLESGLSIQEILEEFENDLRKWRVKRIVAHNVEFDVCILTSECYRYRRTGLIEFLNGLEKFCTMKRGMDVMGMDRYPKLIVLFKHFFGEDAEFKQHSALDDCIACQRCYERMMKLL